MRNIKICCILMLLCFLLLSSVSFASATKVSDTCIEGHTLFEEGRVEPTCGETGVILYGCKNCTYVKAEVIPPTYKHTILTQMIKEPTCLEDGLGFDYCLSCPFKGKERKLLRSNYSEEQLHNFQFGYMISCKTCYLH